MGAMSPQEAAAVIAAFGLIVASTVTALGVLLRRDHRGVKDQLDRMEGDNRDDHTRIEQKIDGHIAAHADHDLDG